jgi:cathepsin A (carboxypeptidase C)
VGVGFSYSDDGSKVDRSTVAGEDVYAFFQLFFAAFPEYASAPFHIASESYGGTYAPHAASIFHKKNKELSVAPIPRLTRINLASVILANGITNPLEQLATVRDYACYGPYRVLDPDGKECSSMKRGSAVCERLMGACYRFPTRPGCLSAAYYCYSQLYTPIESEWRMTTPYSTPVTVHLFTHRDGIEPIRRAEAMQGAGVRTGMFPGNWLAGNLDERRRCEEVAWS